MIAISSLTPNSKRLIHQGRITFGSASHEVRLFVDSGAERCFIDEKFVGEMGIQLVELKTPMYLVMADGSRSSQPVIKHETVPLQLQVNNHLETIVFLVAKLSCPIIIGHSWLKLHNPDINWETGAIKFGSEFCSDNCNITVRPRKKTAEVDLKEVCIRDTQLDVLLSSINIDDSIDDCIHTCSLESHVYPLVESKPEDSGNVLPQEISDFADVFEVKTSDTLPPHRSYDCEIQINPNSKPPVGRLYSQTVEETEIMKGWIDENLKKGFIRPSSSPFAAPCFFVRKPDWTNDKKLRLCMDYRGLNSVTVKDRYPIPLISDMIRTLANGKVFTTLDLQGAYNLLRMKSGHEKYTAFNTKFGQFEFLVMPFGLCNAPAAFQKMMNDMFKDKIGTYVLVYLDDIVIYSKNLDDHWQHVRAVLQVLRENKLYCNLKKSQFAKTEISYLGHIISDMAVKMDPRKIKAVMEWPTPKCVKDTQSFVGFTNYYRRFIKNFAQLMTPLTRLLRKDETFIWSSDCQRSFEQIKLLFSSSPLLCHPDENKPFVLEVDASDFGVGGVLAQYQDDNQLHPTAFFSRGLNPAERNYEIYDKELLAIHECFEEWRHFLQGGKYQVTVLTDHNNLKYFMSTKQLTRRQARWSLFLNEFNFVIVHKPGSLNGRADLLSRRSDYIVEREEHNLIRMLKPQQIAAINCAIPGNDLHADWKFVAEHFLNASEQMEKINLSTVIEIMKVESVMLSPVTCEEIDYETDWPLLIEVFLRTNEWPAEVPDAIASLCRKNLSKFQLKHDKLHHVADDQRTLTPYLSSSHRQNNIKRFHDGLGHLKSGSIIALVKRRYWWPKMDDEIKDYVSRCPKCQLDQSATGRHHKVPIKPIPPVALPFERWGVDAVTNLTETKNGNRNILTAIDYATRWVVAKAVPNINSATVAQFLYEILMNYGSPHEIITDRGSSFLSEGLKEFERIQQIRHYASTPYHPQTNGMVERMHAMLGHALTTLTDGFPDRWDEYLAQTVFSLRVRIHAVTKQSPFYLLYGVHPRIPGDTNPLESSMAPLDEIEELEKRGEIIARTFEEMGDSRRAAFERSKMQAELMRKRNNLDPDAPDYYFKVGDWVKLKNHTAQKFEFDWKGPYVIVDVGFPGTYWLMTPDGRRFDNTTNEADLAPWLAVTKPNENYFYDGSRRRRTVQGGG